MDSRLSELLLCVATMLSISWESGSESCPWKGPFAGSLLINRHSERCSDVSDAWAEGSMGEIIIISRAKKGAGCDEGGGVRLRK